MTNEETAKPLKPCPFCGSEPEIRPYSSQGIEIRCKKCLFKKQQKVLHKSVEWLEGKMIEDWNSRVKEKENAELRAEINRYVLANRFLCDSQEEADFMNKINQLQIENESLKAEVERLREGYQEMRDVLVRQFYLCDKGTEGYLIMKKALDKYPEI